MVMLGLEEGEPGAAGDLLGAGPAVVGKGDGIFGAGELV